MIISNSTPLIYLARLRKIDLVIKMYGKIIIPREVYDEVIVKGKLLQKTEVVLLEELIKNASIIIQEAGKLHHEIKSIHLGEAKAINLCLQQNTKKILIDDKDAYELCKFFHLTPIRTTAFLLSCVREKLITKKEFKELLIELSKEGYFMSAEVFQLLVTEVEKQ